MKYNLHAMIDHKNPQDFFVRSVVTANSRDTVKQWLVAPSSGGKTYIQVINAYLLM